MGYKDKEKQREYQLAWMHKRRQDWIESQGGKCACGSTDRLEVDHIDPSTKTREVRDIWSRKQIDRDTELAKCQVLCYDCHQSKGQQKGDCAGNLQISRSIVDAIRKEYIPRVVTQKFLAEKYGVSETSVYGYVNNHTRVYDW